MVPQLLFDIAKCSNFCTLIQHGNISNPCNDIINFQRQQDAVNAIDFQLPEPWNGDIINAPILVISSNPAYSKIELYPNLCWPEPMIADFFINRFKDRGPKYSWIYNNRVLNINGTRGKPVRYLISIQKRIEEILLRSVKPGIDYCITEIVHCKSSNQIGVAKALHQCASRFLTAKIGISGAKIIIGIGSIVRDYFKGKNNINGIPIIYLPHPNAFKPKTVAKIYTDEELNKIRDIISNKINLKETNLKKNINYYSNISLPTDKEVEDFINKQIDAHNGTVL